MKLSEAIMLGAALKPQGFGQILRDGKTCALGAAHDSLGLSFRCEYGGGCELENLYPFLMGQQFECPECGGGDRLAFIIASHLNDRHKWSREKIAEWVASIEPSTEITEVGQGQSEILEEVNG